MLLGYYSEEFNQTFWDKVEVLPECLIIQREIKKAISGQSFFYNDEDGQKVLCEAITNQEMKYYLDIWSNFHHFGLPHGKGWIAERQWLLNFIKIFEKVFKEVQDFVQEKDKKNLENQSRGYNGWRD